MMTHESPDVYPPSPTIKKSFYTDDSDLTLTGQMTAVLLLPLSI